MAFDLKRRFYEHLPLPVKKSVCLVPFSWLAGRAYREAYRRGAWFDTATAEELKQYQEGKLGEILRFAVEQIPAYQSLRPVVDRHKPLEALKAFPLLDKNTVQADLGRHLPRDFDRIPHYEATTGGTSGNQLKFYLDDSSQSVDLGFMHRQWARVGITPRDRKATFRGVPFSKAKEGVYWQYNPIYNELQFSPFHMSEKNLGSYVEEILRYAPDCFHGYPSALSVLAEYVLRNGLTDKFRGIRVALLGSEGTSLAQRQRIEQAFRLQAYTWYGHSERVVLAGECEKSHACHHFPDYGVLEIIDDHANACEREGERGEIVGTGLLNRSLPLIRYRTGDYATRLDSQCECGRVWDRFCEVEGRWKQEMVIGRNGARISMAALNMHGPLFDRVVRFQYYQDTAGVCILKIMAAPGFAEKDRVALENAYRKKVGEEVLFKVEAVSDIPLTVRGKAKILDSRLDPAANG